MSATIPFDTHAYVKKLLAAGFSEPQAEVQAQALAELVNEQLTTKRDLKESETALRRDLKELESNLRRDLNELETTLRRDTKELETALRREIEAMRLELRRDMKELELRMTVKLGALIAAAAGLIVILQQVLK